MPVRTILSFPRLAARFALAAALAPALGACSSDGTSDPAPAPTASAPTFTNVQAIFTRSCALSSSCHSGSSPQNNLSLEAGKAYAIVGKDSTLAGQKLVAAGNPEGSLIYMSLLAPVQTVERMPQASPALPAAEIALIKQWIADGAKND
jgi:hypothetical protein